MTEVREDGTIPDLLARAASLLDEAAALEISPQLTEDLLGIAEAIRSIEIPGS